MLINCKSIRHCQFTEWNHSFSFSWSSEFILYYSVIYLVSLSTEQRHHEASQSQNAEKGEEAPDDKFEGAKLFFGFYFIFIIFFEIFFFDFLLKANFFRAR